MDYEKIKNFWQSRNINGNLLWRKDLIDLNVKIIEKRHFNGCKILDMGCGNAEVSGHFTKNSKVIGVDFIDCKYSGNNFKFIKSDVRSFSIDDKFDIILMFGIANFLTDDDLSTVYSNCKKMMNDNSVLLIKHQSSLFKDKIVDNYSEDLNADYCSIYRSIYHDIRIIKKHLKLLKYGKAYSDKYNKWPDTKFMLFTASI
jgi:SAM-dependent methyltransferase